MMHSYLFVPATEEKLNKIETITSGTVIVDLEDSIPQTQKEYALGIVKNFLKNTSNKNVYVRVNSDNWLHEVRELSNYQIKGYMLPKLENVDVYEENSELFQGKSIIGLIETAKGMVNIEKIVSHSMIDAVAFGAEDYTCSMNMENNFQTLLYPRSRIVMYAKAYEKTVIDTPSFEYKDMDALTKEVAQIADMGFDGKLAIHPKQVEIINKVFSLYDTETMKEIIMAYEQQGEGVLIYNGRVFEKPHINRMRKILESLDK